MRSPVTTVVATARFIASVHPSRPLPRCDDRSEGVSRRSFPASGRVLCKLHQAAFDVNVIAIRPDLVIGVSRKVFEEIDRPMLCHGLQETHGRLSSCQAVLSSAPGRPAEAAGGAPSRFLLLSGK